MNRLLILILAFTLFSCNSRGQIEIPEKVNVGDLSKKQRIGKTRIYIENRNEYKFIPDLLRLQKNNNQYIQFVEIPNQDFSSTIQKMINKLKQIEAQGGKLKLEKEFKLGEYDAFIVLAPQGNEEQIVCVFGDNTFSAMVMGIYPNDNDIRKEVVDMVLTTDLKKDLNVNLDEQLNYNIKLNQTLYQLSSVNGNIGIYTIKGEQLTNEDWQKNHFLVSILPIPKNFDLKQYSDNMITKLGQNYFKEKRIDIEIIDENKINQQNIEVEMKGKTINNEILLYQYMKLTSDGLIQFIGFAFENKEQQIKVFKEISKSIKIK